jgi:hypothetical protein
MAKIRKAELKRILKKCLKDQKNDKVHGIPHTERIFQNFKDFCLGNKKISQFKEALSYAVYLHDLGRRIPNSVEHGVDSVKILKDYFKHTWEKIEEDIKDKVFYSIERHSDFAPEEELKEDRDYCLACLVLLDIIDTIGEEGFNRPIIQCKIPLIPWDGDPKRIIKIKKVDNLIKKPKHSNDNIEMKDSSILEHVVYNYCYAREVFDKLKKAKYITKNFNKKIEKKFEITKKILNSILISIKNPDLDASVRKPKRAQNSP